MDHHRTTFAAAMMALCFTGCGGSQACDGSCAEGPEVPVPSARVPPAERRTEGAARPVDASPVPLPARDRARVYWVGHSLITGADPHHADNQPLDELVGELARSAGHVYSSYRHTVPG